MSDIDEKILIELENLKRENLIKNVLYSKNLNEISFENNAGKWELTKIDRDVCEDCGETKPYIAILDGFTQRTICENCLLYSLQNYEKCGWN